LTLGLKVDTYGKRLPSENKGAVDRLDPASGSKMVATAQNSSEVPVEDIDLFGGPCRDRTGGR